MGMEPASWAAIAGIISAAAGIGTAAISMSNKPKAKSPEGMPKDDVPGPDEARQRVEAEEMMRRRKGRAATNLLGDESKAAVATTQSGARTLLG